jgi:hypothetical protein
MIQDDNDSVVYVGGQWGCRKYLLVFIDVMSKMASLYHQSQMYLMQEGDKDAKVPYLI